MDMSTVDDMLMNSFGMADLGNIDIDKYQKGIFSPSPKNNMMPSSPGQKATSPQKKPTCGSTISSTTTTTTTTAAK